ncbi:uncharacterized protein LOC113331522 [Papaver somniferum]|uniref:uncharacterized protein LOC113331522 n=1 Tax=Papaver somniferum TaxID=3469 RepID=UPI000E700B86|nr:uncharacterized protein LOC113331522 [Papaver somniferum]XP_026434017.1 uncharacterized protein LOC113331522 [Papaver somniferum]
MHARWLFNLNWAVPLCLDKDLWVAKERGRKAHVMEGHLKMLRVSEDSRQSLEKISTAAVECRNLWNNKISSSGNLVPLSEFQKLLESHGLLWHKNIVSEKGVDVTPNQLRSRIDRRPYDLSRLLPDLTSESLWEKATEDFFKVCRICHELERNFNREQQLLGRSCGRNSDLGEFPPAECSHVFLPSKSMKQLVLSNIKRLDQLHCVLQRKIVGKSSVTEKLIGCFYDVLSKGKMIEKEYFDGLEHKNKLLQETGSLVDNEVISEIEFAKSVKKTVKQIDEAVQKLVSLRDSILSEDSPHRNIALWRVLYESSLVNLQLDLIYENLGGTIKFGVKLLDNAQPRYSDRFESASCVNC